MLDKYTPENEYAYNLTKHNIISTLYCAHNKKLIKNNEVIFFTYNYKL